MPDAVSAFIVFLKKKNLKLTKQREKILHTFLKTEEHLSVDALYNVVKKRYKNIGHATIFRTLRLLCEAGIAKEVDFGDKLRYEHKYGHQHHDHLICVECGKFIEVANEKIEKLQDELCKRRGFLPHRHKMEIFGICKQCRSKSR